MFGTFPENGSVQLPRASMKDTVHVIAKLENGGENKIGKSHPRISPGLADGVTHLEVQTSGIGRVIVHWPTTCCGWVIGSRCAPKGWPGV